MADKNQDPSFKKFLESIKEQNKSQESWQKKDLEVTQKDSALQKKQLDKIANLLEGILSNFSVKPNATGPTIKPKETPASTDRAARALGAYTVPEEDKTLREKLKEEVGGLKYIVGNIGKSIAAPFKFGKELLTNPKRTFGKGVENAKDILSTKADYSVEKERFVKEYVAQGGGRGGKKKFDELQKRNEELKEEEKASPLKSLVAGVLGKELPKEKDVKTKPAVEADKNEENDNFVSAQEQIADTTKADLDLTREMLAIQKEQLGELKKISEAFVSRIPSELPEPKVAAQPKESTGGEEDSGGLGLTDLLPGKKTLRSLGKGARALGRGALSAGKGVLKFAGSRAGMIAGGALAIGAGAYTAYKGYTGAEEEKQTGLQEIEAKQQAGEITPEEAEAQKKQLGEATVEKKSGAVGEGTGMAVGAIGGMKAGAALGATIGSIVPGAGTAVGAGIGALAGGALGAFAGSKAGKVVGEYGGKAINAVGNFISGAKDTFSRGTSGTQAFQNIDEETAKRAKAAGAVDEAGNIVDAEKYKKISEEVKGEVLAADKSANRLSDVSVSSNSEVKDTQTVDSEGRTSTTSTFNKGIVSEKSVLGSTKLGALFSAKGLKTGSFVTEGSASQEGPEGSTYKSSTLLGERTSGGLLGKDTFTVTKEDGQKVNVGKADYARIQDLAKEGKADEANKALADIETKQAKEKEASVYTPTSPEETVTPMGEGATGLAQTKETKPGLFSRIGQKAKDTYGYVKKQIGLDLSGGVGKEQAEQLISSKSDVADTQTASNEGVTNTSKLNQGIVAEKSLFGSNFLGNLFSKKGQQTGQFMGAGSESKNIETPGGETSKFKSGSLLGRRESGGLFSKDKYSISLEGKDGEAEYDTQFNKKDYMQIQGLVKDNKYDEAVAKYKELKAKQDVQPAASQKGELGSQMVKESIDNQDLNREASKPDGAGQAIVSNNVSNNTKTVITPPKPTPRNTELDVSPLRDYQRRATVF